MKRSTGVVGTGKWSATGPMRFGICALLVLFGLVEAGCGTARRGTPTQSEFEPEQQELAHGRQVFMEYCNSCHPGGEGGLGPAINNKPLPAWLIRFQVRRGLGVMPAFSDDVISDEELRDLARYLVALRHHDGD